MLLDVDECLTVNPCLNGATCHNSHGTYRCECPSGYKGKHCGNGNQIPELIINGLFYQIYLLTVKRTSLHTTIAATVG